MDKKSNGRSPGRSKTRPGSAFRRGTGLMGATEPGQRVTPENMSELPPGSVVRNGDGSRLIRLHDTLWLWCCDASWTYDYAENLGCRLDKHSAVCRLAPDTEWTKTPPTEQGEYWHWNGDEDCAPYQLCVMYSGTSGKHFVCIKDDGQTRFVDDPVWDGWWKLIPAPSLPNTNSAAE